MKNLLIFISALFLFNSYAVNNSKKSIQISNIWARPSYGQSLNSAIYMSIRNTGDMDYLTQAETTVAKMTELHKTVTEQGISQMVHINKLALPKGVTVKLAPKGLHVMLMGLDRPMKIGDSFELVLTFKNSGKVKVTVPVKIEG